MINRKLEKLIKQNLKSGQVVVLYGPRRVGKTTLVNNLINNLSGKIEFLKTYKDSLYNVINPDNISGFVY